MKNQNKSNSSRKDKNIYNKSSHSQNNSNSSKSSKKNNFFKNNHFKNKEDYRLNNESGSNLKLTKSRNSRSNSKLYSANKNSENYRDSKNKKNFEDWIWGKHSVFEALKSERAINRIWCTSEIFSSEKFYILLKDLKSKGVLLEEVSWKRLSQLTLGAAHQGIAIQLACTKTTSLEKLISISKINSNNPLILALDGITDPHNIGAIIRSAEAFDCKGIIIPQRRSAGLTGTVAKVAAGALEHIPVCRVVNLNRAIDELKRNGFLIVGLCGDGKIPISNFDEKSPLVVVVGSEDKGISLLTQKKCDFLLSIPLKGKTSSLNASVATAISLFHFSNN